MGSHRQIAVAAVVLAATTACGNDRHSSPTTVSPLPPAVSASPTSSGTYGLSDGDQVRVIYREFTIENWAAEKLPPAKRRAYLARWMIDPALSRYVEGMAQLRDEGRIDKGKPVSHLMGIRINQNTAVLNDCSDQSTVTTVTSKGKIVDRGDRYTWLIITMKRTSSGWRVSDTNVRDTSCAGM